MVRLNRQTHNPRAIDSAFLVLCFAGLTAVSQAQTPNEFPLPNAKSTPQCIAPGPDGALWFAERQNSKIGRMTTSGTLTNEFSASAQSGSLTLRMQCITPGPDGNLWFTITETTNGVYGKITPAGLVTVFPTLITTARLFTIVSGPDGALWFTEAGFNVSRIGRITTAGVLTEYPVPTANGTFGIESSITVGPDGALWFTEWDANKIGRLDPTKRTGCETTPSLCITEYSIPGSGKSPYGIAAGPDGNLWFTEFNGNAIGRITPAGVVTEFPLSGSPQPRGIAAGADGALWFTEGAANKIGRITTAGQVSEVNVPTASSQPEGITTGPDGNIWFTELDGNKIARINLGSGGGSTPSPTPTRTPTLSVTPTRTPTGTSSGAPRGHVTPVSRPPVISQTGRQ